MSIKGLRSKILVLRAWPWYSTWAIRDRQFCTPKSWCRLRNTSSSMTTKITFSSINWHLPMAEWLGWFVSCRATWVRFLPASETFCRLRPLCVALSRSVHWHVRFWNCCALYKFFFLGFRQRRSRADRVLTLNMNIRLSLFWSTWSRGQDSATCAGLAHMGVIIAIVEPPS